MTESGPTDEVEDPGPTDEVEDPGPTDEAGAPDATDTAGTPRPIDLEVGYEAEPTNVPPDRPRFSWRIETARRGHGQTAYRVLVGRNRETVEADVGDVWDSGRVESPRSTAVEYDGVPLEPDETYHWTVRVWDDRGAASDLAEPASFSTSLAADHEWDAEWIAHQPGSGDSNGFRTRWRRPDEASPAWVQVDLGERVDIDGFELHPATPFDGPQTPDGTVVSSLFAGGDAQDHPITARGPEGFGFPRRYRIEVADDPAFEAPSVVLDRTDRRYDNPGDEVVAVDADATFDGDASGRYVRVVATEFFRVRPDDPHQGYQAVDYDRVSEEHRPWSVFALAGLVVRDENGVDVARRRPVTASSSVESTTWGRDRLVDGSSASSVASTSPQLRTAFELSAPVESARAHVAPMGYGELYVNGERVGDRVLDPAWTDYDRTVHYTTYDLTDHLAAGENAVGLWLGRGWFGKNDYAWTGSGSPRALVRIEVTYGDGTSRLVTSDATWRATASPIVENDVYDGETYDARREEEGWGGPGVHGWAEPGFDDADWDDAAVVPGPDGELEPQRIEPVRRVRTFEPTVVGRWEGATDADRRDDASDDGRRDDASDDGRRQGGVVLDVGQNVAGWVELAIDDPDPGQVVELAHAEALTDDGDLSTVDLRSAEATDRYVARGDDRETFEPRFTYHGFRYVRVTGLDPDDLVVTAHACHTDVDAGGSFACSNEDLEQVQHAAEWSLRGNAVGLPTGCAQRDERTGWTGDAQLSALAMLYNFDAVRFYEKWLGDHADDRSTHGCLADVIPHVQGGKPGDPSWTVTQVVLPWALYRFYGDRTVLEDHYEGMRRYVDYWHASSDDGLIGADDGKYGDWLAFEGTRGESPVGRPLELFNTASHYRVTDAMAKAASVLGRGVDARRYRDRAESIAAAFDDEFLSADGVYGPGTQAAYAVPLHLGMVPLERRREVVDNLVAKVRADGERLQTGFLGTRALIHALAEHGHADLAYRLVSQPDRPGWVHMVRNGATTLWERWDSGERIGSGMNSFNHHQFAYVSEWFYSVLAGLSPDGADDDGRLRVEIAPTFVDDLDWVEGLHEMPNGTASSRWERDGEAYSVAVSVPWNSAAVLRFPREPDATRCSTGGRNLDPTVDGSSLPAGVTGVEAERSDLVIHLRAGDYEFTLEP